MTIDLFGSDLFAQSARLDLPGADINLRSDFLSRAESDRLFATLLAETEWQEKNVFVWGKWYPQPRLVAWHGDADASYSYSGSTLVPSPWTAALSHIRQLAEDATQARFNSVLLNLYRDQNDRVGWHSDNEPELGPTPTIASVSLGETRELLFKHRVEKLGTHKIPLTHGSLLVMSGDTQRNWLHAINKESRPTGKRINLTFRQIRY